MEYFGITLHSLGIFCITIVFLYVAIFGFVMADLRSGIRKAKKAGEYRSSRKLRDTVNKLAKYYNVVMMLTLVDFILIFAVSCLNINIPHFPYFTLISSFGVAFIEIKSVFEKLTDKEKARVQEAASTLIRLSKDKDISNIIDSIIDLSNKLKEQEAKK